MKQLLVILAITAVVWLGLAMSDEEEHAMHVRVETVGYDTLRYAVVAADTAIDVRVRMNGFTAFLYSFFRAEWVCPIRYAGEGSTLSAGPDIVGEALRAQFPGVHLVEISTDSLRVQLAPRSSRTFKPSIEHASFSFAEQYGLYGEPMLSPSEVVVYGSEESLRQIECLNVSKVAYANISSSSRYRLPLEPVWESLPGVYPSCTSVEVFLPVEAYVEREFMVPVTVAGADPAFRYHVYPPQVKVNAWVAKCDLERKPQLAVSIDYQQVRSHSQHLVPTLSEFPSYIRPRSIEPSEVQCIVIQ